MASGRSKDAMNTSRIDKRGEQGVVTPKELPPDYVYRFQEASEWANTIRVIQADFALRRESRHLDTCRHLDIICRNEEEEEEEEEKGIVLHFRMRDVYLLGFSLGHDVYEFGKPGDAVQLAGSKFLGYGSRYGDMEADDLTKITIGYKSLEGALFKMIKGKDLKEAKRTNWMAEIKSFIPTVLVMLPECVRFKWHYLAVRRMMTGALNQGASHMVKDWMEVGIKNWEDTSLVAFEKDHTDRKNGQPPLDENHVYDKDDMNKALKDWKRKYVIYKWPKLEAEVERWSLHDEMSKLFNASLNDCFPGFEEDADLFPSYNKEHDDYNCLAGGLQYLTVGLW
nr:hypothetical protein [Tanacetum cinerariifolium]